MKSANPPYLAWVVSAVLVTTLCALVMAEEGMFPVSDIQSIGLMEMGVELSASEIFNTNPSETCLVDGICRVNGCTGSFVSAQGLIFTNHHCAYAAIQRASTPANDYLENGFSAKTLADEIPAAGYEVRITESVVDVSERVLDAVDASMTPADRNAAIERRMKELEQEAETANPAIRAEVAEMFAGKSYFLFEYTFIRDVRLVFAPPSSVGVFGGDIDNWEWPRHTGDFSFLRAYVAPDGSSASYAEENVPYQPRRHVTVAEQGIGEGDTVFLLGYPGRTARHTTASYLQYQRDLRLPFVVSLYQWQIGLMEQASVDDREVALKLASRIRSLANVEKRSRGQLQGIRRARIVESRREAERGLRSFIDSDPTRQQTYGDVLPALDEVYASMMETGDYELAFENLFSAPQTLAIAMTLVDAAHERQKEDLERESPFMERNLERTRSRLTIQVASRQAEVDQLILAGMLDRVAATESDNAIAEGLTRARNIGLSDFQTTRLADNEAVMQWFDATPDELAETNDPFLQLALDMYPEYLRLRDLDEARQGRLSELYARMVDVKQAFLGENFVPDANATLRMTIGRVEGYWPADAIYKAPRTTLSGVMEKTTGEAPFVTPESIQERFREGVTGPWVDPELNDIPVNLLYSADTTGGNSGSPIFNARGELVGINFDRAFEATINDFAWDQGYSRSIGCDIRYALWVTGPVSGANHLLEEIQGKTKQSSENR